MWQYNYSDELYHYGVKGMRWGHRKASRVSTDGSAKRAYDMAKEKLRDAKARKQIANKQYDAAFYEGRKLKNMFGEGNRKTTNDLIKTAENAGRADKAYKAAKAAAKAAKKMAKVEAKEVKKLYRESYMNGSSAVRKIWAKITAVDKDFADYAYKKHNGAFDKNYNW